MDALEVLDGGRTAPGAVAAHLHGLVLSGRLAPGTRLPPIPELARHFGVSIAGIRESLAALEAAGIVDVRHGHGTFVRERPPEEQAFAGWLSFGAEPDELRGLIEARRPVETTLAALAAERRTAAEATELVAALEELERSTHDAESFVDADLQFHLHVAAAAHSPVLRRLLVALSTLLRNQIVLHVEDSIHDDGGLRASIARHRAVAGAVAAGDPAGAARAMEAIMVRAETFALARAGG
jgi:GntR family transcriptional repressor for pyruvate dehydrogenase complex